MNNYTGCWHVSCTTVLYFACSSFRPFDLPDFSVSWWSVVLYAMKPVFVRMSWSIASCHQMVQKSAPLPTVANSTNAVLFIVDCTFTHTWCLIPANRVSNTWLFFMCVVVNGARRPGCVSSSQHQSSCLSLNTSQMMFESSTVLLPALIFFLCKIFHICFIFGSLPHQSEHLLTALRRDWADL